MFGPIPNLGFQERQPQFFLLLVMTSVLKMSGTAQCCASCCAHLDLPWKRMRKGWEKDGKRVCFALFEGCLSMCKGHRVNLCNAQSWVLKQNVTVRDAFQCRWDMQQSTWWRLLERPLDKCLDLFQLDWLRMADAAQLPLVH